MATDDVLRELLKTSRVIAVVGMSRDHHKAAFRIPMGMRSHGYTIVPVNPGCDEIRGMKCYPSVMDVPDGIEIVNVFRPSEFIPEVTARIVERHRDRGDVKAIWCQLGIGSREGERMAREAGLEWVEDRCIWVERGRLLD